MYLQTVATIKTTRECTASAPPSDSSGHSQEEVSIGSATPLRHDPLRLQYCLSGYMCMCRRCGTRIRRSGRGKRRWRGSGGRRSWLRCQRCKDISSTRTKSCSSRAWRSSTPLPPPHWSTGTQTHHAAKSHGSNISFQMVSSNFSFFTS